MASTTWISEKRAAEILDRQRRHIRIQCKTGKWPIRITRPDGGSYLYSLQDINAYLDSMSTHVNITKVTPATT